MSDILKTIANRIRFHRKSKGLTQVQLSQDSGVEHRHLQKIEAGTVDLRLGTISKIAKSLNVPACYLLEDGAAPLTKTNENGCPVEIVRELSIPLVALDNELKIKFVNEAFVHHFGYDASELINKMYVYQLWNNNQDGPVAKEVIKYFLEKHPEPRPFLATYRRKDGSTVERQVHWNYVHDEKGSIVGFVGVYFDPVSKPVANSFLELAPISRHN